MTARETARFAMPAFSLTLSAILSLGLPLAAPAAVLEPSESACTATDFQQPDQGGSSDPDELQQPATPQPAPAVTARDSVAARERKDSFPNLNIYLPEGEFDIRIRKLIKNVLFEGQVNYKFVDGDISTFLRYKYYAKNLTYKIGVFDTLEFAGVETGRSEDFQRVRGGLLLFEYPTNYNSRYFFLTQLDGLSFGNTANPDYGKNNLYTKIAYQYGTPFDERLNAIVGESRGRITPVLTAYRDIGPQRLGLALAVTEGIDAVGGDYHYTKVETEGLKRFDMRSNFLVSRLHVGSIVQKKKLDAPPQAPQLERYAVPNYEYFRIGGRDAMKGIDDNLRGSDEIHLTNEFFTPIFRGEDFRTWLAHWNNLYGVGYLGAGALGFDSETFSKLNDYAIDAGLGVEAGLTVRDYDVYLTVVYARTLHAPDLLAGHEIRFSIRTSR